MPGPSAQRRKAMNAVKRMKVKSSTLVFCVCSNKTVHVRVREGGMGIKVEVEEKKKKALHL